MRRMVAMVAVAVSGFALNVVPASGTTGITVGAGLASYHHGAGGYRGSIPFVGPYSFTGVFAFGGQPYVGTLNVVGPSPDGSAGFAPPSAGGPWGALGPFTLSGSGLNAPQGTCWGYIGSGAISSVSLPVTDFRLVRCQAAVGGAAPVSAVFNIVGVPTGATNNGDVSAEALVGAAVLTS